MNKDVISISTEDDITDIISSIKASEKKIVALVPPKPAGILRSAVNIKLIAKTAEEAEKVPVIVTTDPALLKLASKAHIPVADDLSSRPYVPTEEDVENALASEDDEASEEFVAPVKSARKFINDEDNEEDNEDDEDDEDEEKPSKKKNSKKPKKGKFAKNHPWLATKGKIVIPAVAVVLAAAGFLVYTLVFAASASIYLRTTTSSFAFDKDNLVTFTEKETESNPSDGKFYLKKETNSVKQRANFTATGKKDNGDKASGGLEVSLYFDISKDASTVKVPAGTEFSVGDLVYKSIKEVIYTFDIEDDDTVCENSSELKVLKRDGCMITKTINIAATEPGEKYNIKDQTDEWTVGLNAPIAVVDSAATNIEAISGGKSKIVTTVLQSDVDKAIEGIKTILDSSNYKDELINSIDNKKFYILQQTYNSGELNFEVSPAVGEEVKEGTTPTVTATKEDYVFVVEIARMEEFIEKKINIAEDQKLYSYGSPFIEGFNATDNGYSGKLKTTYQTGPKITEDIVFEKVSGRKVGDAVSQINSITGVDTGKTKIDTSFLLNSIPEDRNKVTIEIDFGE